MHEVAARGFESSAEAYERGRPGYPRAAVDWLAQRLDLRAGRTVVDVAAGTGKLTRRLAETGADVIAVEPVASMRALIGPGVRALEGTAESLPLPDGAADAVTVAQAFHWFAGREALLEFQRVLRPGGLLGLIWNRRSPEDPLQAALEELFAPHRGEVPSHGTGNWRSAFEQGPPFGALEERTFENAQVLDAQGLADRIGSTSFIADLPERERADVLEGARALAGGGTVTLRYLTEVYVAPRSD